MHLDSEFHVVPCVDSKKFGFEKILTKLLHQHIYMNTSILPIVVHYLLEDPTWQVFFFAKIPVQ